MEFIYCESATSRRMKTWSREPVKEEDKERRIAERGAAVNFGRKY